jgi:hypothetical protein
MELGPGDAFLGAEPLDCQTARLLAANAIAPNIVELRVGAPCHRVDSWNGTKWSASQATRPDKDGYLGRLRKNWLFLGNDEAGSRAAVLCTIIAGAKRHRLEPWAYLRGVILQLSVDSSREYLETLLPDRWALAHPEHVLNHRVEESREKARSRDQRREARRRQST